MPSERSDRNLLLGMMALQLEFISREQLLEALHGWIANKSKLVTQILCEQGVLSQQRREQLEQIVADRIDENAGDIAKSLAGVSKALSLHEELLRLSDDEICQSLNVKPASSEPSDEGRGDAGPNAAGLDPYATQFSPELQNSASLRFQRLRAHAEGGLGVVWVAHDQELNREVVVKEIKPRQADDPDARTQFLLEGEITGGLEHPGIVPVYGMGRYPDGRPYYAMRFIRGDSLRDAIEGYHRSHPDRLLGSEQNTVDLRKLLGRFIDVCQAISYAHSRRVLHRDLKPDNVMLGKFGETLVVDWGLAQAGSDTQSVDAPSNEPPLRPLSGSLQTKAGSLIGSIQYMSPEQAKGQLDLLNATSDIYSLGATLYNLLTGKPSIEAPNIAAALRKIQAGDFPTPRQIRSDIPKPLEAICLKAMSAKQQDRYPTAQSLADDIECWLADEAVTACPETGWQKAQRWLRKHRTWAQAAAVSLLIITLVSTAALYFIDQARRDEMHAKTLEQIARETVETAASFDIELRDELNPRRRDIALRDATKFSRNSFQNFQSKLDQLNSLRAEGIEVKFESLQAGVADYLGEYLDSQHFDAVAQAEYDRCVNDFYAVFDERAADARAEWVRLRDERMTKWNTVLDLQAFNQDDLAAFDGMTSDIRLEENRLVRSPASNQTLAVPMIRFPACDVEWSVEFSGTWTARQIVGLTMQYGAAISPNDVVAQTAPQVATYEFLVTTAEFDHRDRSPTSIERLPTIERSSQSGEWAGVRMIVLRNGEIMRSRMIGLQRGPIKLTCTRIDDVLTFSALPYGSVGQTLACHDPFVVPVQPGNLGIVWPVAAQITGMTVRQKVVPPKPSPTEQGDIYLSQGKYLDALSAYRSIENSLEAKYKLALTYELTGDQELYETTLNELVSATAQGESEEAWVLRAMVRQMAVHARDASRVRQDVQLLRATQHSSDVFALLPQAERDLVLQELMKIGLRFRLVFQTAEDTEFIETRNELLEVLLEDDDTRRHALWRAADVYRISGLIEKAEQILRDLAENSWRNDGNTTTKFSLPISIRDHRILLADLCWLLAAECDRPEDAMAVINRWLPSELSQDRSYTPLLVERARVQLILRERQLALANDAPAQLLLAAAKADLEKFVAAKQSILDLTYMEWGEAQMLLGFIAMEEAFQQGKDRVAAELSAKGYWQDALRRSWSGGPLVISDMSQMVGAEGVMSTNELAIEGIAVSFYKEISSDEVDRNIRNYVPGAGLSSALANRLIKALLSPKGGRFGRLTREEFFNRLFAELYDSEAGITLRKKMILRSCPLKEFQHDPIYHILFRAIYLGGFDEDGFPPSVEPVVWNQLRLLVDLYNAGRLEDSGMERILRIFTGNYTEKTWQDLQTDFGPELSASAAYVFGGVYRQRLEYATARGFFEFAIENPSALPEVIQAARDELAKIRDQR